MTPPTAPAPPADWPPADPACRILLQALDPEADAVQRHLWLQSVLRWVRGGSRSLPAEASVLRVQQLLATAALIPGWNERWARWWQAFTAHLDLAPLLADHGFAPRTAFLSELGQRLRRKLLPIAPDTRDPAVLLDLLFDSASDARWLRRLPPETVRQLAALCAPAGAPLPSAPPADPWDQALVDAIVFAVSQVSATGFATEIRVRMSPEALAQRSFLSLPGHMNALTRAVATHGSRSPQAQAAADALRQQLRQCLEAAQTVYSHLDAYGISVGIVFRLRQLQARVARIEQLLHSLLAAERPTAARDLLATLVQEGHDNRSIRALIAHSSQLTAAKVAERSAEAGEHYITRNTAEYRAMLRKAAGGGFVLGLTTWGKFALYGLALSPFWAGFAAGLNYALSFVLIQLLHWTVATKQPAVTAPAMVAKLSHIEQPGALQAFVDEVAHLFRSQVAAIIGNIALVIPTVLVLSLLLWQLQGAPMISPEQAEHVLHDLHILGPTALFAAFTGCLLFASSIIAGWCENWFVLHRLDSALAHHRHLTRLLGAPRAARWAAWLRAHISGLVANTSLGLLLGIVPAVAAFFGLGLEVRHVTLAAGQLTAAVAALGVQSLATPGFWLAAAGVAVVGPLNLAVSFTLAFSLALKARAISGLDRQRIRAAVWQRVRSQPRSFLLPPREPTAPA